MEPIHLVIVGVAIGICLIALISPMRRGTSVSVFGFVLILLSPLIALFITSAVPLFDTWVNTFRTLGLCLFVWGIVENVLLALRSKNDAPKTVWSRDVEETINP